MPPSITVPESRRCRMRAKECRILAERLRAQRAREVMLKAVSDYERMAREAEQQEIAQGLSRLRAVASDLYLARLSADHPD
ncbi:MAG TPA: hypothetical protein VI479_04310 [Blastocatellia bacterium]